MSGDFAEFLQKCENLLLEIGKWREFLALLSQGKRKFSVFLLFCGGKV